MENRMIRSKSWEILKKNFGSCIKGGIPYLVFVVTSLIVAAVWMISGILRTIESGQFGAASLIAHLGLYGFLVSVIGVLLSFGYLIYLLRMVRHGETGLKNALSGFSRQGVRFLIVTFFLGILVYAVVGLSEYLFDKLDLAWLGSILALVLTVIASLVTWVIPFLIHDDPEESGTGIVRRAWTVMNGRKKKYFALFVPVFMAMFGFLILYVLVGVRVLISAMDDTIALSGVFTSTGISIFYGILVLVAVAFNLYTYILSIVFYETDIARPSYDEVYYSVDYPEE